MADAAGEFLSLVVGLIIGTLIWVALRGLVVQSFDAVLPGAGEGLWLFVIVVLWLAVILGAVRGR